LRAPRSALDDAAVAQRCVVRDRRDEIVETVRGEDQLHRPREPRQHVEDLVPRARVEAVGELVEDEQARFAHQRACDQEPPQLPERERAHAFAHERRDAEPRDDRVDRGAAFGRERAVHVDRVVEAAGDQAAAVDRQFEPHVALLLLGRDVADVGRRRHRAARRAVEAVDPLAAVGIDPLTAADDAQERALARPVGPGERPVLARREFPRDVLEGVVTVEVDVHVTEGDERQNGGHDQRMYATRAVRTLVA
jgi:hypothetical protein